MTFPDPPQGAAPSSPGYGREPSDELPPLPTLAPLPVIKPMAPMPQPPWESDAPAVTPSAPLTAPRPYDAQPYDAAPGRSAPPPPAGHPGAPSFGDSTYGAPASSATEPGPYPPSETTEQREAYAQQYTAPTGPYRAPERFAPEPYKPLHSYGPPVPAADMGSVDTYAQPTSSDWYPQHEAAAPQEVHAQREGQPQPETYLPRATHLGPTATPPPTPWRPELPEPEVSLPAESASPSWQLGTESGATRPTAAEFAPTPAPLVTPTPASVEQVGRHGELDQPSMAAAAGRHVLILGGGEPLGSMIAGQLTAAGHLLALADVAMPTDITPQHDRDGMPVATAQPTVLDCDRFDAEEVVRTVARAEVALGGLDALIVLPAGRHSSARLDTDAATWADEWSTALTAEVLAAACASHIAARSFLARRRAGRIILVVDSRDTSGAQPASAVSSALGQLGTDLSRELAPHGVGVSVVTAGGEGDFALGQVADVVAALLVTPVLTSVGAHIG